MLYIDYFWKCNLVLIIFINIGSGSTRKRKGGPIDMGSNAKTNSKNSTGDQPTNIAVVHSSCDNENAAKVPSIENDYLQ